MAKTDPRWLPVEYRYDQYGRMRRIVEAEGYVMMRRDGAMAVLVSRREWDAMRRLPIDYEPQLKIVQK